MCLLCLSLFTWNIIWCINSQIIYCWNYVRLSTKNVGFVVVWIFYTFVFLDPLVSYHLNRIFWPSVLHRDQWMSVVSLCPRHVLRWHQPVRLYVWTRLARCQLRAQRRRLRDSTLPKWRYVAYFSLSSHFSFILDIKYFVIIYKMPVCVFPGSCIDKVNGYSCVCVEGYDGPHCDLDFRGCRSNPCANGATCRSANGDASYTCVCADGEHRILT